MRGPECAAREARHREQRQDESHPQDAAGAGIPWHPPSGYLLRYGQLVNAAVSWIGWKARPCALVYVFTAPVLVSVTVRVTSTLVSPPAKNQNELLRPQPLMTLPISLQLRGATQSRLSALSTKSGQDQISLHGAPDALSDWSDLI